ncbi:2-hydroxychromene-2-carboxylate isomerase [Ancylobacter pratisalsi]|uniref:2-hydroxychromene-2-carboxylate isomerase n=1 Tax=Ancylobacter pratisalsi TaxID=1745854 RepID=A0A6P1YM82_9HYPH|nr:2-hydroxychromene-2-carboxylate isomerase [Ancylobacter pratisalsi]QIB34468.1 2-hydroxychromene-2-carboxylate isomerase [Ancylobacter pratisalsi]
MSRTIDYYFSTVSPWAFMGYATFLDVVKRHGVHVDFRPVGLGNLFAETGGTALPKRHPARQRYRLVELQRWSEARGLDFHVQPAHWPFNGGVTDRLILAAIRDGHDVAPLIARFGSAVWQRQEDLGDPAQIRAILDELSLPASLLEAADTPEMAAAYEANHARAVEADVFGSPAYVLDGEVFWGQDRIDLLDAALSSGRPPFKP